jgi:hypothetical protein
MSSISLLITGQIKSRGMIDDLNRQLSQAYKIMKNLNYKNEIVISTYENEIIGIDKANFDKLVLNKDPGPDNFRVSPWPIGRRSQRFATNYSRIFTTAISGLKECQNNIVIKTRIELIPNDLSKFKKWIENISIQINVDKTARIAFLTEHYNGVTFSIDGTLGTLPNTIQIAKKEILLDLWNSSQVFWQENFKTLTRKTIMFPITDEQIVGLNYLGVFCGFPISKELKKLKRYYFSITLIKFIIKAENQNYIWTKYSNSGLSVNRFKGTLTIITPKIMKLNGKTEIAKKLCIIKIKKYFHILRRCINSLIVFI